MNMTPTLPLKADLLWCLRQSRPRRLRTMRQFAESEIIIPDGPYEGRQFRCDRQPYTGLWFQAVDSGLWNRYVATGPTQSGKTLSCFIIPLLYHLFEIEETVICGLPDMDMAGDKWREDILPAIERSRYRDLLPRQGGGSRGGRVESLQFQNGATLKFMSGGGGDKSRAGFTSRVVVITEVDGMDQPGASSRESDKVTQLEARTRAYGSRKRIYMECTVSTEEGRTWQEYTSSTRTRVALPCPHCQAWVTPEREHLVGWQGAESQTSARDNAAFHCPECHELWSHAERLTANADSRLVHAGQELLPMTGETLGAAPATTTFGLRWSAVNNLFLTAGDLGADEWRATRASDEENAERELRQFVWCLPIVPTKLEQTSLEVHELASRMLPLARGIVPKTATVLTAAMDLGKYLTHWVVVAWSPNATGHIVDYGRIEVASDELGVEQALLVAMREFRDLMKTGWNREGPKSAPLTPATIWIDAGYMTPTVYTFCREAGGVYRPSFGRGTDQQRHQWYNRPTQTGSVVRHLGEGFHMNHVRNERLFIVEVDADYWKTWTHERLNTPVGTAGAMTLFDAPPNSHLAFVKHLTAEIKTEEFLPGKGLRVKWERIRKQNHWLDALYNACAAGQFAGVRLVDEPPKASRPRPTLQQLHDNQEGWFKNARRNVNWRR